MDFARKQLEKYGWSEGKGLGRNEDGISTAIKPKLKFDNSGVGHNVGEQFTNNWWEKLFNNAADNVNVQVDDNNDIKMNVKCKDAVEITTKNYSVKAFKKNTNLEYGSFLKTATMTGNDVKMHDVPNLPEIKSNFQSLTDEELFAACGGRTAHKGARHGLKLGGKLSRIQKQEKLLLKKMRKVSISDNESEKTSTEKKLKKLKKQKEEAREKYIPIMEDSMESTSSNGLKKKKKRKSVSFSETVIVTPIYTVDLDTSFESELGSVKGDNIEPHLEAIASGSDEGIEQDIENNNNNNNNNDYSDNHRSFEVGQFNINDLSKAERKKLKKKRKLEAKKNTPTVIFLQQLNIDPRDDEDAVDFEEDKDINLKKRKYLDDAGSSKMECHSKNRKKKDKQKRKKRKADEKLNTLVKSLDTVCRISESE
ncbi:uncharacterized protein [Diabrotica undecimpunctata]|uniref:uncharacterized protein n=1 Tax=Diabrotica undecimpunctata TaxID=50387 RepID=UPI003B640046